MTLRSQPDKGDEAKRDMVPKERLQALTDGVYTVALTLLVLELEIAPLPNGATDAQIVQTLIEVVPKALTWLLSF